MRQDSEPQDRFFTGSDGLRLHARDWGPRHTSHLPLVCLPGLARTARDFDALAASISTGGAGPARRVLAIDYRGRGESGYDRNWRNYDMRVENADILTVLDGAGIGHAVFLGTSRGGLHIMMMTATRPAAIAGAILNDIGPVIEAKGIARIKGYVGKLPAPVSWQDAANIAKRIMSAQFDSLSEEDWDAYARLTFKEENGRFVARYDTNLFRPLAELDLDQPLPQLWPQFAGLSHVPLMAIRGAHSDLLSQETFAQMQARHPDCASLTVPGQGHAPLLLDDPTIQAIGRFVTGVDERAAA